MLLLDTHILIWLATGNPALGPRTRELIEAAWSDIGVAVSAISYLELATAWRRGRLETPIDPPAMRDAFRQMGLRDLPIDADIAFRAGFLDNFHGDPMDRLIVATALDGHQLVTRDRQILNWSGPLQTIPANR